MQGSNDISIRYAQTSDNAAGIAKLIYLTDTYIYPYLCDNFDDAIWVDFVGRALKHENHVHFAKNMLLATCHDSIVGLLCAYPLPSNKVFLLPVDDAVKARYVRVWEGYYKHANVHSESLYISNLCVDPTFRGRGIGAALLSSFLKDHPFETITLDVLADNSPAVALYKKAGFAISSAYNGFSGKSDGVVKCLSMAKKACEKP